MASDCFAIRVPNWMCGSKMKHEKLRFKTMQNVNCIFLTNCIYGSLGSLYIYIYICIYKHIHTCIYIYIYICMCVQMWRCMKIYSGWLPLNNVVRCMPCFPLCRVFWSADLYRPLCQSGAVSEVQIFRRHLPQNFLVAVALIQVRGVTYAH
jgi:hypothetical protein